METYCITCKKHTPHKSLSVKFFFININLQLKIKKTKQKKTFARHLGT